VLLYACCKYPTFFFLRSNELSKDICYLYKRILWGKFVRPHICEAKNLTSDLSRRLLKLSPPASCHGEAAYHDPDQTAAILLMLVYLAVTVGPLLAIQIRERQSF
jgi:hypothetical protein